MNLNHLVYFRTLAKYEHYHKASEILHITQPSLSNAIHNLEVDLGVRLFEKKGRGVRLTLQGERFLEYVNSALHELEVGTQMMSYEQGGEDEALNLGIVLSVVQSYLPEWVSEFEKRTGKRFFYSCRNGTSNTLCSELVSENVELIICSKMDDPKIDFIPLVRQNLFLLVPPDHPLSRRKSVDIHEINGESFIAHSRGSAMHTILADIYRKNNIQVKIISEADEDRTIMGLIRAGLGCGVTAYSSLLKEDGLAAIPLTGSGFDQQICIGKKKDASLSATARAFYDYLTKDWKKADAEPDEQVN